MSADADPRRSVTATRVIHASPETIYQAFASAEAMMQWLPPAGMSGRALEYDLQEAAAIATPLVFPLFFLVALLGAIESKKRREGVQNVRSRAETHD